MPVVRDFTALPAYNWNYVAAEALPVGRPTLLTYSFPDAASPALIGWVGEGAAKTFSPFTEAERTIVRSTLEKMAAVAGLTLIEVSGNNGDIRVGCVDFTKLGAAYQSFNGVSQLNSPAPFWRANDGNIYPSSEEYWQHFGNYTDQFGDIIVNLNYRSYPYPKDWLVDITLHEFGHSL
jgi:hypothetical protein